MQDAAKEYFELAIEIALKKGKPVSLFQLLWNKQFYESDMAPEIIMYIKEKFNFQFFFDRKNHSYYMFYFNIEDKFRLEVFKAKYRKIKKSKITPD